MKIKFDGLRSEFANVAAWNSAANQKTRFHSEHVHGSLFHKFVVPWFIRPPCLVYQMQITTKLGASV